MEDDITQDKGGRLVPRGHEEAFLSARFDAQVDKDWTVFRQRLADLLAAGDTSLFMFGLGGWRETCVVIEREPDILRLLVPSNHLLRTGHRLSNAQKKALLGLGFSKPCTVKEFRGRDADGRRVDPDRALYLITRPVSHADEIAVLAVRAITEVLGVTHPTLLNELAGPLYTPPAPVPPEVDKGPALDVAHPVESREALVALVESLLCAELGLTELVQDDDGSWPILRDQALVRVLVLDRSPIIQVSCPLVTKLPSRSKAKAEVHRLNRGAVLQRYELVGSMIVAYTTVLGHPFVPRHLVDVLDGFTQHMNKVGPELVERLGGVLYTEQESEQLELPVQVPSDLLLPFLGPDVPEELERVRVLVNMLAEHEQLPRFVAAVCKEDPATLQRVLSCVLRAHLRVTTETSSDDSLRAEVAALLEAVQAAVHLVSPPR